MPRITVDGGESVMATTSTVASTDRWEERRVAAALLRAALLLAPLAASSLSLWLVVGLWPPPTGSRLWWLAGLCAVGCVIGIVVERACRRFLPLVSLLRLTMLFPDNAPSRYKLARSAGNSKDLLERLARHPDDSAQQAAEKVLALVTALGKHDSHTRGHSERVRLFADMLAAELGMEHHDRDRLRWAALLHDVGKLEIAPAILNKPAALNDHEFARIRQHPVIGADIAAPLLPWLGEWAGGIIDHHERWDGRGYPHGRKANEISRAGRLVCLVDAFETMTAARSYKKAQSTKTARAELVACAGSQFDPTYVRAFLDISLPRLIWTMGPLSFLVQLPFLRGIAQVGAQVTSVPVQAAAVTTASVAAAGAVVLPVAGHADALASRQASLAAAQAAQLPDAGAGPAANPSTSAGRRAVTPADLPGAAGRHSHRHVTTPRANHHARIARSHPGADMAVPHGSAHATSDRGRSADAHSGTPDGSQHGKPVKPPQAATPKPSHPGPPHSTEPPVSGGGDGSGGAGQGQDQGQDQGGGPGQDGGGGNSQGGNGQD